MRIVYNLTPYVDANNLFLIELREAIPKGKLVIARIFDLLPLNIIRPFDGRQRLEGRGDGAFSIRDGAFVNSSNHSELITFLDDQLDEITVHFPVNIVLSITDDGTSITVQSVGDRIVARFKVLDPDIPVVGELRFDNFVIGINRMITTFVDEAGNQIIVDGGVDRSFKRRPTLIAALRDGAEGPCPKPDDPPEESWKYAINRSGTSGYCRIITPGMEWGNRRLGIYDTEAEAERAMKEFLNDGEPPNNDNPTCEGRG